MGGNLAAPGCGSLNHQHVHPRTAAETDEPALAKSAEHFSNDAAAQKYVYWSVLFCTGCSEIPSYILLAFNKGISEKL